MISSSNDTVYIVRTMAYYDDDEIDEDGWADEYGDSTEAINVICSNCGAEVSDDTIECPICNQYIHSDGVGIKMHWRVVSLVLLVLGAIWLVNRIMLLFE